MIVRAEGMTMTYDTYRYIFYGGAGLALLFLVVSDILFFVLKIPSVIGDLSGSTAKKAIENIRKQNELGSVHSTESNASYNKKGVRVDKNNPMGTTSIGKPPNSNGDAFLTTKIGTEQLSLEAKKSYETSLLENNGGNETTVLNTAEYGGTTVLQETSNNIFAIEYEIILVHTNEVIN